MTIYNDSSYGMTRYVSNQKTALSYDSLKLFSDFTNGGSIPFYVRYQYSADLIVTGGTATSPVYGGWGPLDESVDKMMGTPGLRFIFNLAYLPKFWLAIDKNGNNVGYGNGILPDGPAMATFATAVTNRYANLINTGKIVLQIGNEEYDTGLNGTVGGTILAYTFNYAAQAIKAIAPNALIIVGAMRPLSHPTGAAGPLAWMTNYWTYVPKVGEPPQAIPNAHDFHYYDDSSTITANGNPAPDPTTTDNSDSPKNATKPSLPGVVSIIQGVLDQYSPSTQIWNLENGYNLPNNSPNNHNNNPSEIPSQQSRYTRSVAAQMQYALGTNGKYAFYSVLDSGNDPRALSGTTISDYTSYIAANPQWTTAAPTAYLYQSVDALSFEGTVGTAPIDQYFSIMNPTGSNQSWSISSNQGWLTSKTLPTNGKNGTNGANLTAGTLAPGQCITLKCSADSTVNGLTTLTTLSGTLTVTIGGNVSTIAVSLFVTPNTANPNLTSGSAGPNNGPTFSMAVNAGAPANQTITFKNTDAYATWWYAFTTANWFSINTASGTLAAGATQNITISITGAVASLLAPGTYTEVLTISATPFPPQYTTSDNPPPATTQFITVIVKLTVTAAHTPTIAVQVSTPTLNYSAVASGTLPASQTFFLHNCTNAAENWTATKTQTWLTLTPASGSNLPQNGTTTGTSPNIQHTDYQVVTASINTTGLAVGTYTDTITVTLGGTATQTISVSYVVFTPANTQTIGASPGSVTPSQVQGGAPVIATTTLTNSGNTTGTYTTTKTNAATWLKITPNTGQITGSGGTQVVTFTCTPGTLTPGVYTSTVTFTLGTSTANVTVTFTVTATGSPANLAASPAAMTFSDIVGQAQAAHQSVTLTNTGGTTGTWTSSIAYASGANWVILLPTTDTLIAGASEAVTVSMNDSSLKVGTYTATITFTVGANTAKVKITLVINPTTVSSSAQMMASDLGAQYARIMASVVGPELSILATTYYGTSTSNQTIYGELDALFPFENMSQLHVMKSINDVTAFINAYAYVANVLSDNPIVYYRLNELSGISASDISGRKMTGTISNILGVLSGVTLGQTGAIAASSDTAMLFDGSTGNITLPAGVNAANWSSLTVEVWIKPSNVTFSQTAFIVANDAPLSTNLGFMIAISKNAVIFRIGKSTSYYEINKAYTFAANTWYHLAGVFSGTSLTVYLNGNQLATTTVASALVAQTTNVVNIASRPGSTASNFPGTLQHPALYKAALSAARLQAHYLGYTTGTTYVALVMADNPQAYYRLNEVSGTTAFDNTTNHYDATMTGTLTYSQVGIIGSDTAISFTTTGELVMPAALGAGTWGAQTLEYWINITSGYQHLVIAGDASGTTVYLNGAPYTSGSGPDTAVVGPEVLYAGSLSAGTLSQVSIYKYVLSAAQVANHFQVGSLGV